MALLNEHPRQGFSGNAARPTRVMNAGLGCAAFFVFALPFLPGSQHEDTI